MSVRAQQARWDAAPILALIDAPTDAARGLRLGFARSHAGAAVSKARHDGITTTMAARWCARLGVQPPTVWPDWIDLDTIRWPAGPLLRACKYPARTLSECDALLRVDHGQTQRWMIRGLTDAAADTAATRLLCHPSQIWPDWFAPTGFEVGAVVA